MKTLKALLLTLSFLFCQFAFAQDELKAKIEFEKAEKTMIEGNLEEAIDQLNKTEQLLGKWTPKVSYLRIQALDKVCDYNDLNNENTKSLIKEAKTYMKFAEANPTSVVEDKYKVVLAIDENLKATTKNLRDLNAKGFLEAKQAEEQKNYVKAMELYVKESENENANAMGKIGVLYENGLGVSKDEAVALKWYKKADEKGLLYATIKIGDYYLKGLGGLTMNTPTARDWYRKAVDRKSIEGMFKLGIAFGYYPADYETGKIWFQKAAEKGSIDAMRELGKNYSIGIAGAIKDERVAMLWYERAAEAGDSTSLKEVLDIYTRDVNDKFLISRKEAFFLKYADKVNTAEGLFEVGKRYDDGKGVAQNYAIAMQLYLKASEKIKLPMFYIALMYHYGNGVEKNFLKAVEWYIKENSSLSLKNASELYKQGGFNLEKDSEKARELLKQSKILKAKGK